MMPNETQQTWNAIAHLYQSKFMQFELYNQSYDLFCDLLIQPSAKILELGCGPGNITRYLLDKRPDFNILATDYAPNMVETAQQNNPEAQCISLDCRDIAQLDGPFDGMVAGFVIPYLSPTELLDFMRDAAAILAPGGLLYLSFVEGTAEESGYKTGSNGLRVFFNYHPLEPLMQTAQALGFHGVKRFKFPFERENAATEIHTVLILSIP
jgi:trans-aconitate methyltransferase